MDEKRQSCGQVNSKPDPLKQLGCHSQGSEDLEKEGWQFRFTGDPRMVRESTETYSDMGFEVMSIPIDQANIQEHCLGCEIVLKTFKMVYTRKKSSTEEDKTFQV